jgi:tryptophan-rich sensory protein
MSPLRQFTGLVCWLLLSYVAAAVGGVAAAVQASTFYAALARPEWAPPAWLFGPVWSLLYTMMGVAAWLVWRANGGAIHRQAHLLFVAQLVLNALWSWLFFVWHQGGLALAEVLMLWAMILATLLSFGKVSKPAAILLLPYQAWVSFAGVLNFSLWRLNPGLLG